MSRRTTNTATWRKSTYSGGEGGNCVEVRSSVDAIRDSKRPDGAVLLTPGLPALLEAVKAGLFDG